LAQIEYKASQRKNNPWVVLLTQTMKCAIKGHFPVVTGLVGHYRKAWVFAMKYGVFL
jgi:hypothetical protein